jgi:hypothetical protein
MKPTLITDTPRIREIAAVVERIKPILMGRPPEIIGGILADLLAIWLAGHHVEGDEDATRTMRADLLAIHCGAVRNLVTVNAKILGTTP